MQLWVVALSMDIVNIQKNRPISMYKLKKNIFASSRLHVTLNPHCKKTNLSVGCPIGVWKYVENAIFLEQLLTSSD